MKITKEYLVSENACKQGMDWVTENGLIGLEHKEFIARLMQSDHFDWANWLISRILNRENKIKYAIFAAEQVIDVYEKSFPNDNRPRNAVDAAREYLNNPTPARARAAAAAYAAAYAAPARARAAAAAAYAAAYAADAAAYAADDADAAAYAAAAAAYAAYAAAAAAYAAAYAEMEHRIIKYGIELFDCQ